jgi:hypothetical protein
MKHYAKVSTVESKHTTDYRTLLIGLYAATVKYSSRYKLDGPWIESQWQRYFLHPSRPALGPAQPSVWWASFSCPGERRPKFGVDQPPQFRAEAKERVQLNLYTPSGPLWPVIGWTYPFYFDFDCKLLYRKKGSLEIHNASKQNNIHGFRFRTSAFA